jgi:NAD(P)-dependent dehydrogenase (short-subunit alcohol dehydrogenase family)
MLPFAAAGALAFAATIALRRATRPRFEHLVVIVTGARGLAFVLAEEFGRRGARLALVARDPEELHRAKERLEAMGFTVLTCASDVCDEADAAGLVGDVLAHYGRIDVIVNDAGTIAVGPLRSMKRADYEDSLATHFWAAYNMVEAAWDALVATQGSVVNVTSIGGRISVPHLVPYSVGKFAEVAYSEGLRAEAARYGIRVTTVTGLMRTGSPRNAKFKGDNRAEYAWFDLADTIPGLSVPASYAARRIVDATGRGEANVAIGIPAFLATRIHGLSPGLFARTMELAAALLPHDTNPRRRSGAESESDVTRSPFTALGRDAEEDYNERGL